MQQVEAFKGLIKLDGKTQLTNSALVRLKFVTRSEIFLFSLLLCRVFTEMSSCSSSQSRAAETEAVMFEQK